VFEERRVALGLQPPRRIVLALAGIGRTRHALGPLAAALGPEDQLALIAYPSTRAGVAVHAARLRALLGDLHGVERVAIVTHSLGALVARTALAGPPGERQRWPCIDGVVMLFPPNRGAAQADRWHRTLAYRALLGPAGQELTTAAAPAVPLPVDPVVVIAGGRGDGRGRNRHLVGDDDGTVRVEETRLPGAKHQVIDVGHTFGMRDQRVIAAVREALAAF
jgi:pimeloyl-ACP methyl ester carboxylesterase